jgi:hypothetical protein
MESTLEVLTPRKSGREVHRHWPDEVKAQIVSESLRPGASIGRTRSSRVMTLERRTGRPCLTHRDLQAK